jgi:hypothetical protein
MPSSGHEDEMIVTDALCQVDGLQNLQSIDCSWGTSLVLINNRILKQFLQVQDATMTAVSFSAATESKCTNLER